jgi:hypothetical protein
MLPKAKTNRSAASIELTRGTKGLQKKYLKLKPIDLQITLTYLSDGVSYAHITFFKRWNPSLEKKRLRLLKMARTTKFQLFFISFFMKL